jgi:hypothetical protein
MKNTRHCLALVLVVGVGASCGSNKGTGYLPDASSDSVVTPARDASPADAPTVADAFMRDLSPGVDQVSADRAPSPDGASKDAPLGPDTTSADSRPTDSKPSSDLAATDAKAGCSFGDRSYAVGETFKNDCNTCSCQANGTIACTLMACPPTDASTTDGAAECKLPAAITFGFDGGNAIYRDVNRIDTAGILTITRTMSGRGGGDGGSTSCSLALPACGTAGAVTAATLATDLADPDVKAGFAATSTPFYGVDQRPMDGPAYSITQADGHTILVGATCTTSSGSTCLVIPAGVQRLVDDLMKAASTVLAAPVCKGL